jgi:hypothetical protein
MEVAAKASCDLAYEEKVLEIRDNKRFMLPFS